MENENDKLIEMGRYKILIDDIRYSKRQQWIITYYILLFHFGLFSLLKLNFLSFLIVFLFSLFATILATIVLLISYFKLKEYRSKKDEIGKDLFGDKDNGKNWDYFFFTCVFIFFSWLGFVFLCLSNLIGR